MKVTLRHCVGHALLVLAFLALGPWQNHAAQPPTDHPIAALGTSAPSQPGITLAALGTAPPSQLGSTSAPPVLQPVLPPVDPLWKTFLKFIAKALKPLGGEFTTLLTLVFGSLLAWAIARARRLKRRLAGPRFGLPPAQVERMNRALILGIPGTGKTSLIESIMFTKDADPRAKTAGVNTYSLVIESASEKVVTVSRIDLDDYPGQNVGRLVEEQMAKLEKGNAIPVTSLVFVVDLFEPPSKNEIQATAMQWSKSRVTKNVAAWSEEAISAMLGLAESRQKLICLFVNKTDLLSATDGSTETLIRKAYEPLIDRIALRSAGARFEILVGSAKLNVKTGGLLRLLVEAAQSVVD